MKSSVFEEVTDFFRSVIREFPDKRTGTNKTYSVEDIGLSAFSIFFTQSPSFLSYQRSMEKAKGKSNARTLFGISKIPSDNHIRDILDEVSPEFIFKTFDKILEIFEDSNIAERFFYLRDSYLIGLDGTWYFSSSEIHCENCNKIRHKDGREEYYHSAITPVIVSPNSHDVIALRPEFIKPQDGHEKQDCEIAAAKRWLKKNGEYYRRLNPTLLGDDLYAKQPFCVQAAADGYHFIFVCKPKSHKNLYEWLNGLEKGVDIHVNTEKLRNGKNREIHQYSYANDVPLRDGEDGLRVNWCEIVITKENGEILYQNSFITDYLISDQNVKKIAKAGRSRWKIENENNNTLKTKGYNLEHNFGHGKNKLSALFAAMNILAFLFHTVLQYTDKKYRLIWDNLPSRKTFFEDIRALTRYICFESFQDLMNFMIRGLEIEIDTG
jgi:hypothetical protein